MTSISFLADAPPTPSKKHPYIKLASTKKAKWHLGLFNVHATIFMLISKNLVNIMCIYRPSLPFTERACI